MAENDRDERTWERGWEGHASLQRRRLAQLSLIEKLEWLESAHRVVLELEKSRARVRGEKDSGS